MKFNIILLVIIIFFSSTAAVLADSSSLALNLQDAFEIDDDSNNDPLDNAASTAGFQTAGAKTRMNVIIATIIQAVLAFLGVVFLILMIYGGYMWMTARGNEEQVNKASKTIVAAIVGLIIILSAYAISFFVIKALEEKTLKSSALPSSYSLLLAKH